MKIRDPEFGDICSTPLMAAAYLGHAEVVTVLAKAGASVDQAISGRTALMVGAEKGHTAIVQALLKAGARIEQGDSIGITALFEAVSAGHVATVQALLQAGAHWASRNSDGHTALSLAIKGNHVKIIQLLRARSRLLERISPDRLTPVPEREASETRFDNGRFFIRFRHWRRVPRRGPMSKTTATATSTASATACGGCMDPSIQPLRGNAVNLTRQNLDFNFRSLSEVRSS